MTNQEEEFRLLKPRGGLFLFSPTKPQRTDLPGHHNLEEAICVMGCNDYLSNLRARIAWLSKLSN